MKTTIQNNREHRTAYVRRQRGIGLLEILITVLLLSIGFLAAAKMQVQGMRFSQSAYTQAQAYFMISEMMDRMRSNLAAVRDGHYDNLVTSSNMTNPNCDTNFCTPERLADQDLFDWSAMLFPLRGGQNFIPVLPSSDNIVAEASVTAVGNGYYQLRAEWIERIGDQDKPQEMMLEFAL